MAENRRWLQCPGNIKFPISDISEPEPDTQTLRFKDSTESTSYTVCKTGLKITTYDDDDDSNLTGFVSGHTTRKSPIFGTERYVLTSKSYDLLLDQWLQRYNGVESELYTVQCPGGIFAQIMRPTKYGLALIKGLLKAVADIHAKQMFLSHPMKIGITTLSNGTVNVVLIPENRKSVAAQTRQTDYEYLNTLIFDRILQTRNGFANSKNNLPPPRFPIGLVKLQTRLRQTGDKLLHSCRNDNSLMTWESRIKVIKGQFDANTCTCGSTPLLWNTMLPNEGALRAFYNDVKAFNNNTDVAPYEQTRKGLLRYMRNFFVHHLKKAYCVGNFQNPEYVEMVISETFEAYYSSFF